LLRDSQVLTIWEGTTNVLALDALRALRDGEAEVARAEIERCSLLVRDERLRTALANAMAWVGTAAAWRESAAREGPDELQAGARRYALALGRALELALTAAHAQWSLDVEGDARAAAATTRLASTPPPISSARLLDARALANDLPLERS
jgi:hypothetical protein